MSPQPQTPREDQIQASIRDMQALTAIVNAVTAVGRNIFARPDPLNSVMTDASASDCLEEIRQILRERDAL